MEGWVSPYIMTTPYPLFSACDAIVANRRFQRAKIKAQIKISFIASPCAVSIASVASDS